ncbi:MAG: DNA polymerase I, partial [Eubacteriales bacterium]|nr:DNA polymerase I [Eubacteriales bacterium]
FRTLVYAEEDMSKLSGDALNKYKIEIKNVIFDTMIGAYILNATKNKYEYNHIADEFLEIAYPDVEELLGRLKSKKQLFEIEEEEWLKYCVRQSKVSYLAKKIMEKEIKANEQEELFYNIEMPLIYVLASMEILGIKASEEELIEYKENLEKEIENLTKEIYWLAGDEEFNINSPKQLGAILFDKMGLKGSKKTATGWSTSADILEKIIDQSEIIPKILEYRTYAKLKSTYAEGLLNVLDKKTGRIHSNFKQTVTATGRLSSTEPNLQNIPIKLELGHKIRKVFKPEKDFLFVDADYSQIELRVLAHLSGDEILIKSFNEGQDIHRLTASQIFGKNIDEVSSFERSAAKAINFGLIYGKQAFSLSQELGITKKDAENYIDGYFEKYPKIKGVLDSIIEDTRKNGYAKTMFNRKRYIPEINSTNSKQKNAAERVAMNTPIQGTAADIIKIAMVKVYERIKKESLKSRLILQVHDELLIEAHKDETEQIKTILLEEMQNAIEFSVKLLIDIHTGENWYETK